jgi:hypothetical protein
MWHPDLALAFFHLAAQPPDALLQGIVAGAAALLICGWLRAVARILVKDHRR